MDRNNFQDLSAVHGVCTAPVRMREVPDPYFRATGSFERVFELVEAASAGLLADIKRWFPSILGPV